MERVKNWLQIIGVVIAAVSIFIFFILMPTYDWFVEKTWNAEIRIAIRLFLLMFGVLVFAVLRMYNATVQNTRFNIKLLKAVEKLTSFFPKLEKGNKDVTNSQSNLRHAIEELQKAAKNIKI